MPENLCPVCGSNLQDAGHGSDEFQYDCPNCGRFGLSGSAQALAKHRISTSPLLAAKLSYMLRRMQRSNEWVSLGSDMIDYAEQTDLPDPATQANNFILWLGNEQKHPGQFVRFQHSDLTAALGAFDIDGVGFIVRSLQDYGLIQSENTIGISRAHLTMEGWDLFHRLSYGSTSSSQAFMAMAFENDMLADIFVNFFKPAASQAGFNLIRLDENPQAGSIDERLRVEIRRSNFLVADLSDHNPGAYWEAGFAEGLGKPVIYTCNCDVFDVKGTHFDTNHLHTVIWSESDPQHAANELKATIRATLPDESIMNDE